MPTWENPTPGTDGHVVTYGEWNILVNDLLTLAQHQHDGQDGQGAEFAAAGFTVGQRVYIERGLMERATAKSYSPTAAWDATNKNVYFTLTSPTTALALDWPEHPIVIDQSPHFKVGLAPATAVTPQEVALWGFVNSVGAAASLPNEVIAFRLTQTGSGSPVYEAVTRHAASGTTATSTGVAVSTVMKEFKIAVDFSVPKVDFYIDGVKVATNTTNIPPSGTLMYPAVIADGNGTSSVIKLPASVSWSLLPRYQ